MAKKWIAINLLLLVVAGLLGWQLRASILRFIAENDPAKIQPRNAKQTTAQGKALVPLTPDKNHPPADFSQIAEHSIFSDSRGKEDPAETMAPPEPPQLTQKPILVGTIIVNNQYKALIIDPAGSSQDRNRRPETKRIGDVYRGFTITSIAAGHIVLENGTRREIIPLHEGTKKAQPGKTPALSTRVVPFGGGGISGGASIGTASRGTPTARNPIAPAGAAPPGQPNVSFPGAAQTRQTVVTPPPQGQTETPQPSTPPATGTGTGTGTGTRTIRSPFGDIIRPNRN